MDSFSGSQGRRSFLRSVLDDSNLHKSKTRKHSKSRARSRNKPLLDSINEVLAVSSSPSPLTPNGISLHPMTGPSSSSARAAVFLSDLRDDVFDSDSDLSPSSLPRSHSHSHLSHIRARKKTRGRSSAHGAVSVARRKQQRDLLQHRYHGMHAGLMGRLPSSSSEESPLRQPSPASLRKQSTLMRVNNLSSALHHPLSPPRHSPTRQPHVTFDTRADQSPSRAEATRSDENTWGARKDKHRSKREKSEKRSRGISSHKRAVVVPPDGLVSSHSDSHLLRHTPTLTCTFLRSLAARRAHASSSTLGDAQARTPSLTTPLLADVDSEGTRGLDSFDADVGSAAKAGREPGEGFGVLPLSVTGMSVDIPEHEHEREDVYGYEDDYSYGYVPPARLSPSAGWQDYSFFSHPAATSAEPTATSAPSPAVPTDTWAAVWQRIDRPFEVARALTQVLLALCFAYFLASAAAKEYRYQRTGMNVWQDVMLPEDIDDETFDGTFLLSDTEQVFGVVEHVVELFHSGNGVERFTYPNTPVLCKVYRSSNVSESTDNGPDDDGDDEDDGDEDEDPAWLSRRDRQLYQFRQDWDPAVYASTRTHAIATAGSDVAAITDPTSTALTTNAEPPAATPIRLRRLTRGGRCRSRRKCARAKLALWKRRSRLPHAAAAPHHSSRGRRSHKSAPRRRHSSRSYTQLPRHAPVSFAPASTFPAARHEPQAQGSPLLAGLSSLSSLQGAATRSLSSLFASVFPVRQPLTHANEPTTHYSALQHATTTQSSPALPGSDKHSDPIPNVLFPVRVARAHIDVAQELPHASAMQAQQSFTHTFPLTPGSLGPFAYADTQPARFVQWLQLTNITKIALKTDVEHLLFFETRYCMRWELTLWLKYNRETNHLWGWVERQDRLCRKDGVTISSSVEHVNVLLVITLLSLVQVLIYTIKYAHVLFLHARRLYNWWRLRREQGTLSQRVGTYLALSLQQELATHTHSCAHDMALVDAAAQLVVYTCTPQGRAVAHTLRSVRRRWRQHQVMSAQVQQPRFHMELRWYLLVIISFAINTVIYSLSQRRAITKITLTSQAITFFFALAGFLSFFLLMPTVSRFPSSYTLFQASFHKAIPIVARIVVGVLPVLMGFVISAVAMFNNVPRMASVDLALMNLFAIMKGDNVLSVFEDFAAASGSTLSLIGSRLFLYSFSMFFLIIVYKLMFSAVTYVLFLEVDDDEQQEQHVERMREEARDRDGSAMGDGVRSKVKERGDREGKNVRMPGFGSADAAAPTLEQDGDAALLLRDLLIVDEQDHICDDRAQRLCHLRDFLFADLDDYGPAHGTHRRMSSAELSEYSDASYHMETHVPHTPLLRSHLARGALPASAPASSSPPIASPASSLDGTARCDTPQRVRPQPHTPLFAGGSRPATPLVQPRHALSAGAGAAGGFSVGTQVRLLPYPTLTRAPSLPIQPQSVVPVMAPAAREAASAPAAQEKDTSGVKWDEIDVTGDGSGVRQGFVPEYRVLLQQCIDNITSAYMCACKETSHLKEVVAQPYTRGVRASAHTDPNAEEKMSEIEGNVANSISKQDMASTTQDVRNTKDAKLKIIVSHFEKQMYTLMDELQGKLGA